MALYWTVKKWKLWTGAHYLIYLTNHLLTNFLWQSWYNTDFKVIDLHVLFVYWLPVFFLSTHTMYFMLFCINQGVISSPKGLWALKPMSQKFFLFYFDWMPLLSGRNLIINIKWVRPCVIFLWSPTKNIFKKNEHTLFLSSLRGTFCSRAPGIKYMIGLVMLC